MKFTFKLPPQITAYLVKVQPLLKRHYFIVTVVLFSSVAFAVFTVNQTLATPPDDGYRAQQLQTTIGSKFNKDTKNTIQKIKALQKSTDTANTEAPFPPGRINPFAE